jgi:hypothetical protein
MRRKATLALDRQSRDMAAFHGKYGNATLAGFALLTVTLGHFESPVNASRYHGLRLSPQCGSYSQRTLRGNG